MLGFKIFKKYVRLRGIPELVVVVGPIMGAGIGYLWVAEPPDLGLSFESCLGAPMKKKHLPVAGGKGTAA